MVYPRILDIVTYSMGFPGDSAGKESACNAETWVLSLGWEDPLGKGTATHSSILAWRISWTVWSMGSQRVGHNWAILTHSAILYNRILFMHSIQNSYICYTQTLSPSLSPPLIFVITALDDYPFKLQFPHLYNRLKPHRLFWELNIIIHLDFHTVHSNNSNCVN